MPRTRSAEESMDRIREIGNTVSIADLRDFAMELDGYAADLFEQTEGDDIVEDEEGYLS